MIVDGWYVHSYPCMVHFEPATSLTDYSGDLIPSVALDMTLFLPIVIRGNATWWPPPLTYRYIISSLDRCIMR